MGSFWKKKKKKSGNTIPFKILHFSLTNNTKLIH